MGEGDVTDETQEVQATSTLLRTLAAFEDSLIFVEYTLFDGYVDPHDVLPDNATSTNVQVTKRSTSQLEHDRRSTAIVKTYPTSELPISPSLSPTARP